MYGMVSLLNVWSQPYLVSVRHLVLPGELAGDGQQQLACADDHVLAAAAAWGAAPGQASHQVAAHDLVLCHLQGPGGVFADFHSQLQTQ